MTNDIALFKGAGLPATDIAKYKQALTRVQLSAPQIGGTPILKLGKDGIWRYGQKDTEVQDGSEWAVNPTTLKKGFIAWAKSGGTKPLGKVLKPILLGELPIQSELPDVGAEWKENVSFDLRCMNGDDEGITVEYASNAMGGVEAFHVLVAQFLHQLEVDPTRLVPIVILETQGYQHGNLSYGIKGWVEKPVFTIVEWVSGGAETATALSEDEAEEEEQPAEPQQPARRAAAPPRGAAPARETAPERAATRGPVPARGSAIPRNASTRAGAPTRRPVKEADDQDGGESGAPAAGEPTRRRRRAAT